METEERNSTFSGNKLTREKARFNVECDKQITRIRISDMCAQIKQLKTELKRWKGHCNFLMKSLGNGTHILEMCVPRPIELLDS